MQGKNRESGKVLAADAGVCYTCNGVIRACPADSAGAVPAVWNAQEKGEDSMFKRHYRLRSSCLPLLCRIIVSIF